MVRNTSGTMREIQHKVMFKELYDRIDENLANIQNINSRLRAVEDMKLLNFKGTLNQGSFESASGGKYADGTIPVIGDVWNVGNDLTISVDGETRVAYRQGENLVWTENGWDRFYYDVDLSGYALRTEVKEISDRVDAVKGWPNASGHSYSGDWKSNTTGWGVIGADKNYTNGFEISTTTGGGITFADKNGQTSMQIDGYFYQNEGSKRVLDSDDLARLNQGFPQRLKYRPNIGDFGTSQKVSEVFGVSRCIDLRGHVYVISWADVDSYAGKVKTDNKTEYRFSTTLVAFSERWGCEDGSGEYEGVLSTMSTNPSHIGLNDNGGPPWHSVLMFSTTNVMSDEILVTACRQRSASDGATDWGRDYTGAKIIQVWKLC